MAIKLSGPRAFRTVIMAAVAVVTAPFFAAIIIATRQVVGVSSPGNVVLIDGVEQVGVVDLPPFITRKRTTGCRRG